MAAAAHFSTRIYGQIWGSPPYQNAAGQTAFANSQPWTASGIVSLPTTGTNFYPLPNGALIGGAYVYSVIEVQPTGLNVNSTKFVSDSSVATLATLAG